MTKSTGDRYERRLVRFFDAADYAVMRSPSSGSATDRDQPDVYATSGVESIAAEVKYTGDPDGAIYVEEDEVESLRSFAVRAGATPVIAARFARTKVFFVFTPNALPTTEDGSYRVSKAIVDDAHAKLADEDDPEAWNEVRGEGDLIVPRDVDRSGVIAL